MSAPTSAPVARVEHVSVRGELPTGVREAAQRTFLAALPAHSLRRVLRGASLARAAAKAALFNVEDPAREIFVVLEGSVALLASAELDRKAALDIVHPGQLVLPWVPVPETPYAVCAVVLRPAQLLNIPLIDLRAELRRGGLLGELLAQALGTRARALLLQISDLKLRTATQRLAGYLVREATPGGGGFEVLLQHRKHIIASQLGMTPESLSRSFAGLRRLGVSIRGQRVSISDVERLRQFSRHGIDDASLNAGVAT